MDDLAKEWDVLRENLPTDHAEAAEILFDRCDLMADRIEALEAEMEARIAEAVKAEREVAKALADAYAVASQCTVEQESMYDEEGVEGWRWTHPDGREWVETGLWDEGPPRHPLVDDALEKLREWGRQ